MRCLAIIAVTALSLMASGRDARAQAEQQSLVDRATLSLQEILDIGDMSADARSMLGRSRAAMICPRVFRAGFIIGGQGGDCVLVARDGNGSWSSPSFFTMGGGSIGFQIGVQDAQVLMLIMNEKALDAVLNHNFKFGADAGVALGTLGRGISGSTTTAVGGDIVTIARARGLFAGVSLDGAYLDPRTEWNRAYFGRDATARQVVVEMAAHNPGSDPLRAALMRLSEAPAAGGAPMQAAAPQGAAPQGAALPREVITPAPGNTATPRVQSENLPMPPSGTR
ncbi:lipid-binding SYLF domain-containing protein [Roseomonas terrae]|jgi:lipid-binding SYLF domain-containing protein|uniref:Lipid-binding SYLF domain-containing protein n=1 Tax=Neoroseomonas terrae TaxID=424799 RepID=A0ABS5EBR2_9PROT|nr:lipid-binding SYLF domain-containing protein [Neoroseomonas terrae]MBR0648449.1 lipid-binding SYLF domain-containing protein [Neoroseomonas terrae]